MNDLIKCEHRGVVASLLSQRGHRKDIARGMISKYWLLLAIHLFITTIMKFNSLLETIWKHIIPLDFNV